MNQIKQILQSRIRDIQKLKDYQTALKIDAKETEKKYDIILEQKKNQRFRTIKETEALLNLNSLTLSSPKIVQDFYQISVDICSIYDANFHQYSQRISFSSKENIKSLYVDFFRQHGLKSKVKLVMEVCERGLENLSPAMLLGWLSEWSKKIYYEMLQQQIKICFREKKEKKTSNLHFSEIQNPTPFKKSSTKNKNEQVETEVIFLNRATVHGYFLDDLNTYYRFIGLEGLDMNLFKTTRKQGKRQDMMKEINLSKAADVMIETTQNKEIKKIMNEYQKKYRQKYPKKQEFILPIKKKVLKPLKRDEVGKTPSKLLSPTRSKIQFIKPENVEVKIEKLKSVNNRKFPNRKRGFEFPNLKGILSNGRKLSDRFFVSKHKVNRQIPSTELKERIKLKNYFKCESLETRMTPYHEMMMSEQNRLQITSEKVLLKPEVEQQWQYDDSKIKVGKRFTLADLRKQSIPVRQLKINRNLSNQ